MMVDMTLFKIFDIYTEFAVCTWIVVALGLRFLWRRQCSPLRAYPGPFLASGSRLGRFFLWIL